PCALRLGPRSLDGALPIYEATPLMVDGVLYTTAGRRRDVVAIDPVTGETLWMFRLDEGARRGPRVNSGRGLAVYRNDDQTRLIRSEEHTSELQSRENLVCR